MWPRDFLSNDVKERPCDEANPNGPKLRGRFSTVGYQANARNTWSATTTIEKAAENLLIQIRTDRSEVCILHQDDGTNADPLQGFNPSDVLCLS